MSILYARYIFSKYRPPAMFARSETPMLMSRTTISALVISLLVLIGSDAFAATTSYQYDELGRLKVVKNNNVVSNTYSYDAAGNRTQKQSGTTSANHAPVCSSPTINMTGIPSYASASFTMTVSQVLGYCTDADGDSMTVTSPALPLTQSISAGQTISIPYTVSDGKGGTATGTVSWHRS